MIPNSTILEIQSLLGDSTLTAQGIALQVGVSRGTVLNVKSGKCSPRKAKPPRRKQRPVRPGEPDYRRCPICGYKVVWPCLACGLETTKKIDEVPDCLVSGLDLQPMHRKRYEEISHRHEPYPSYEVTGITIQRGKNVK